MKNISRTLIIGLGGTGQNVIRDIKKRLFQRYGEIPGLVKFLAFDTDSDQYYYQDTPFMYYFDGEIHETRQYNLQRDEFLKLTLPTPRVLKEDPVCKNLNVNELEKCYHFINGHGSGGLRPLGRACFLYNSRLIVETLIHTVNELRNACLLETSRTWMDYRLANNDISVYVIGSLAGGTGSSAIMDISRMLQHAGVNIQPIGAPFQADRIFGMFFTPSFFKDKPNTPNVQTNAYVALSELDYTLGLNDLNRYPLGCKELENDLNVYEGFSTYKPVRYSNVYLIDSATRKGHYYSRLFEASAYVASFITSSIAASANVLDSSYSNSTHCIHDVDGKKQLYSGLGYCEIRLDRQNLVKYLLNCQLLEVLADYKDGGESFKLDDVVEKFIEDNQLNEGVMSMGEGEEDTRTARNELTDSIFDPRDRRFIDIVMGKAQTGRDAAYNIENSKVKYLNSLATAAAETVNAFVLKKRDLLTNLNNMLSRCQVMKGFGKFPDLAKRLKDAFVDMKSGLECEISQLQSNVTLLESQLRKIREQINENSSMGFLGVGSRIEAQHAALYSYSKKVELAAATEKDPTLGSLKLEIIRKQEAVAVYDELINVIDRYYKEEIIETGDNKKRIQISGTSLYVAQMYDALRGLVDSENDAYKPSKAAKNETVFADAYFKEYFEQNEANVMNLTMQAEHELEQYIGQLLADRPTVNEEKLAEMRQELLNRLPAGGLIRKIQEGMSIDEMFIQCFGTYDQIADPDDLRTNPQLGMLKQLENNFDLLWQYKTFTNGLTPQKTMVVGVCDLNNHIFTEQNGYSHAIDRGNIEHCQYVGLGDPDRIAFMLVETAIPAHKLVGVDEWAREFKLKKGNPYTFSDKRLEGIEMIMPGMYDEAEIAWAYGWLFGLIINPTNRRSLRVKPSHDYVVRKGIAIENNGGCNCFKNMRPSDIYECHQEFIKDHELSNDILQQAMVLLDGDSVGNAIKIRQWVNDGQMWDPEVRGKQTTSMTPMERRVIQNEVKYLAMRFDKLGLSLNECGRVV